MKICLNCASQRRQVNRSGYCKKCYHWEVKRQKIKDKLKIEFQKNPDDRHFVAPLARVERILEEYRWRELKLQSDDIDTVDIESLIKAIAMECRSAFEVFDYSKLDKIDKNSRKIVFEFLLDILENTPSRIPRLHSLEHPKKGSHLKGWDHDQREWWADGNNIKLIKKLRIEFQQNV